MGRDCEFVSHDARDARLMLLEARARGTVLLTRDTSLTAHAGEARIMLFREQHWRDQLRRLMRELPLEPDEAVYFTRCTLCNVPLVEISRGEGLAAAPPSAAEFDYRFTRCPACGKVYWPGTHLDAVRREIASLRAG